MRPPLTSPVLPRRLMAALILLYGIGVGLGAVTGAAMPGTIPPTVLVIQGGLALCIYAIGIALWSGRLPAWPSGLVLTGLAALRVASPAEAALAVSVLSLSVAGGLAVLLARRLWITGQPTRR